MTRTDRCSRSVSLAEDRRGRIPFALISVLLLVTSVGTVTMLETKPEPEKDVDVGAAMDTAVSSAQTSVRTAVKEAAQEAAREPVTKAAETPAGKAIMDGDGSTFRRYVKLRAYLKTQRKLDRFRQRVSGDTYATVSLPPVVYTEESLERAIDRVDLTTAQDPASQLENGSLQATIKGVNASVYEDGEFQDSRQLSITVTVGTTLFTLHEKTETYENRLQMGFFEPEDAASLNGFGRKFAAMIYPWAYFKAGYERYFGTVASAKHFKSIVENYESTTFANTANLWIQQEVYGTRAQGSTQRLAGGFVCLGTKTAKKVAGSGSGWGAKADTLCQASKIIFSGHSLKETFKTKLKNRGIPGIIEFLKSKTRNVGQSGAEENVQKITIHVNNSADPAYEQATGGTYDWDKDGNFQDVEEEGLEDNIEEARGGSQGEEEYPENFNDATIDAVINDTYAVDAWARYEGVSGRSPSFNVPDKGSGWDLINTDRTVENEEFTVTNTTRWSDGARNRSYFQYSITIENKFTKTKTWEEDCTNCSADTDTTSDSDTVTYSLEIVVGGNYSTGDELDGMDYPHPDVATKGVETVYRHGGSEATPTGTANTNTPYTPHNLSPALGKAVEQTLDPVSDASQARAHLRNGIDATRIDSRSTLTSVVGDKLTSPTEVQLEPANRGQLKMWLRDELNETHQSLKDEVPPVTIPPRKMVTGNPFERLRQNVTAEHNDHDFVYRQADSYGTAPDRALALLRRSYLSDVHDWIDEQQSKREKGKQRMDDIGESKAGGPLSEFFEFVDSAGDIRLDMDVEGNGTVDSNLHPNPDNVTYKIHASPSYFTTKPVTRSTVPAVRPHGETAADPENTLYAPFGAKNKAHLPSPGLPIIPWPSWWYASVNFWNVQVEGKYPRFAVTASTGDPATTDSTTYVRQAQPVHLTINGLDRKVGSVEPINFTSNTLVAIAMPGATVMPYGSYGTGDRVVLNKPKHSLSECTPAWKNVGPGFSTKTPKTPACKNVSQGSSFGWSNISTFIDDGSSSGLVRNIEALTDDDTVGGQLCGDDDDDDQTAGCRDEKLTVEFLEPGDKGAAILVRRIVEEDSSKENKTMLVDTGSYGENNDIVQKLDERDVEEIDHLVVTHNDSDHIGGMVLSEHTRFDKEGLLSSHPDDITIENLYFNGVMAESRESDGLTRDQESLQDLLQGMSIDTDRLTAGEGDDIDLGDEVNVDVLNPPETPRSGCNKQTDCNSIVLKITKDGNNFLLSSDIRTPTEEELKDKFGSVDVLQLAHHGGADSNGVLENLDYDIAVFTGGQNDNPPERIDPQYSTYEDGDLRFVVKDGKLYGPDEEVTTDD